MTTTRWQRSCGALALVLVPTLAGCGTGTSTDRDPDGAAADRPSVTASEPPPSPAQPPRSSPAGAAMGVDRASWPGALAEAKELFDRMPATLAGADIRRPRFFGGAAGVQYGRGNQAPFVWVMEAGRDVPDATAALSVMFGMTMSCAKGSYAGTVPQSPYGGVPDADRSGDYTSGDPWWFTCTVDGAEGDPKFTAHALGWASGDLGWLTITPDRATTRQLVEALLQAR